MHRTLLTKISLLLFLYTLSMVGLAFGQSKPLPELDVTKCWSLPMAEPGSVISSDGTHVFLGSTGAKVEALSFDGNKAWSSDLGGDIASNILPLETGLFLVTSTFSTDSDKPAGSLLRSLSKETGITNWIVKLPNADKHFLGGFGGAIIVVSKSGIVQAIDAKNGNMKWKREIAEAFVAEPVFDTAKVQIAAIGKQIFDVSLSSGEIESLRKVPNTVTSLWSTPAGETLVGDDRGNLASLSGAAKPVWSFKSGGEISKIFTAGNQIFAASNDNFIYSLISRNGNVAWKKRGSGRVLAMGNIMDRFGLVASVDDPSAAFIDLVTGKVVGQIVLREDENITYAPIYVNGRIFLLTNQAAYAYSLDGCSTNKDGGPREITP